MIMYQAQNSPPSPFYVKFSWTFMFLRGCYFHFCWFQNLLHGTLLWKRCPRNGLLFCLFFLILYRSPRLFDDWLKKGSAKRKCKDRSRFLCLDGSYHMETSFKIAIFSNLAFFCHKIVFSVWIFLFKRTWTAMAKSVSLFQFEYIFN